MRHPIAAPTTAPVETPPPPLFELLDPPPTGAAVEDAEGPEDVEEPAAAPELPLAVAVGFAPELAPLGAPFAPERRVEVPMVDLPLLPEITVRMRVWVTPSAFVVVTVFLVVMASIALIARAVRCFGLQLRHLLVTCQ